MNRYIRRASVFGLVLLVALLLNAARVQVFKADAYDANPANRRTALTRYSQPRGNILVGGRPVTGSRDSGGRLRYERTYTEGPLYAAVTGYASQIYGTSLLEHAEDRVLSGTDPRLAPFPLWTDITREQQPGGEVRTTIDAAAQRAAFEGLGARKARWRPSSRAPARFSRWSARRRTTRTSWPAPGGRSPRPGTGSTTAASSRCSTGR